MRSFLLWSHQDCNSADSAIQLLHIFYLQRIENLLMFLGESTSVADKMLCTSLWRAPQPAEDPLGDHMRRPYSVNWELKEITTSTDISQHIFMMKRLCCSEPATGIGTLVSNLTQVTSVDNHSWTEGYSWQPLGWKCSLILPSILDLLLMRIWALYTTSADTNCCCDKCCSSQRSPPNKCTLDQILIRLQLSFLSDWYRRKLWQCQWGRFIFYFREPLSICLCRGFTLDSVWLNHWRLVFVVELWNPYFWWILLNFVQPEPAKKTPG